jgi:hypothetical protein
MIIKYFKDYIDAINEGLIRSHDPDIILNTTLHKLINFDISGELVKSNANDKILIKIKNINSISFENLEIIFNILSENIINIGGFFVSIINIENIHNIKNSIKSDMYEILPNKDYYKNIEIVFESIFDKIENNIPDKLYHLSIKEYQNVILKKGLYPKSKSKLTSHLDRIYLCKSIEDCESLIDQMKLYYNIERDQNLYRFNKKKWAKDTHPIILEIDNSDKFINKLYIDPNSIDVYFIIDNIPPNKIKIIKTYE